jgi:hypothetical protein
MPKKIQRPRGLAKAETEAILMLLKAKKTVDMNDMARCVRARYVFKNIHALRIKGWDIRANRKGRVVVSYTLMSPTARPVPVAA